MTNYFKLLLLAFRDDDITMTDALCDAICDDIIRTESRALATIAYRIALIFDPHASFHAAHIRDTALDNIDNFRS